MPEDYVLSEIPRNAREVFSVGSGETLANRVFDQTASGASAIVTAHATNWTVRNVGWRGEISGDSRAFTCSDRGNNTSVARNLYIGDGTDGSGSQRQPGLGIWVAPEHSGHIDFEYIIIQNANDNSFYCSAPGSNSNGQHGTVALRNCYSKDSWVAHYRLARGTLENCVAVNTSSGRDGRCVWVWPTDYHDGDVEIIDCDFVGGGHPHAYDFGQSGRTTEATVTDTDHAPAGSTRMQGDVQLDETNVGHSPQDRMPDGIPQSPEEAAIGLDDEAPEPEPPEEPVENEDYQIIEVAEGDHEIIEVEDGETLSNITIDCTNDNTAATVRCRGDGWEVRNVAFAGEMDLDSSPCYAITASCDGGDGRIENVWLGDGSDGQCGSMTRNFEGRGGIYTTAAHEGVITIRDIAIERWGSEAIRNDGSGADGGSVDVRRAYVERCNNAHITLAGRESVVRDSVFYHPTGDADGIEVHHHGPLNFLIENCDFQWDGTGSVASSVNGGYATFRNCRFAGDSP